MIKRQRRHSPPPPGSVLSGSGSGSGRASISRSVKKTTPYYQDVLPPINTSEDGDSDSIEASLTDEDLEEDSLSDEDESSVDNDLDLFCDSDDLTYRDDDNQIFASADDADVVSKRQRPRNESKQQLRNQFMKGARYFTQDETLAVSHDIFDDVHKVLNYGPTEFQPRADSAESISRFEHQMGALIDSVVEDVNSHPHPYASESFLPPSFYHLVRLSPKDWLKAQVMNGFSTPVQEVLGRQGVTTADLLSLPRPTPQDLTKMIVYNDVIIGPGRKDSLYTSSGTSLARSGLARLLNYSECLKRGSLKAHEARSFHMRQMMQGTPNFRIMWVSPNDSLPTVPLLAEALLQVYQQTVSFDVGDPDLRRIHVQEKLVDFVTGSVNDSFPLGPPRAFQQLNKVCAFSQGVTKRGMTTADCHFCRETVETLPSCALDKSGKNRICVVYHEQGLGVAHYLCRAQARRQTLEDFPEVCSRCRMKGKAELCDGDADSGETCTPCLEYIGGRTKELPDWHLAKPNNGCIFGKETGFKKSRARMQPTSEKCKKCSQLSQAQRNVYCNAKHDKRCNTCFNSGVGCSKAPDDPLGPYCQPCRELVAVRTRWAKEGLTSAMRKELGIANVPDGKTCSREHPACKQCKKRGVDCYYLERDDQVPEGDDQVP